MNSGKHLFSFMQCCFLYEINLFDYDYDTCMCLPRVKWNPEYGGCLLWGQSEVDLFQEHLDFFLYHYVHC